MEKIITLNLTDQEYRELLLCFHLGFLVKDSVTESTREQMLWQMELLEKTDQQGQN